MLTEVRDCDLLVVVTSSTFLKRKDMLKEKAVSPDYQNPQYSIYIRSFGPEHAASPVLVRKHHTYSDIPVPL